MDVCWVATESAKDFRSIISSLVVGSVVVVDDGKTAEDMDDEIPRS